MTAAWNWSSEMSTAMDQGYFGPPLELDGPAITVGIRSTSSTGASMNRRGRASVRGIGISTYFVTL
jgi:hypothetical protein